LQGVAQYQEIIDLELLKMGAFPAADMTPQLFASKIMMPNLTIQVRNDAWTKNPEDAQKTFDMLGTKEKEMIWVENTTHRFRDGYNYFGRYPEKVLAFFAKYMK
jgi:esterase/lipase